MDGTGTITLNNGGSYEGEWKKGLKNGYGRQVFFVCEIEVISGQMGLSIRGIGLWICRMAKGLLQIIMARKTGGSLKMGCV